MFDRLQVKDVIRTVGSFPDERAQQRLDRLVGLEDKIDALAADLDLLFHPVKAGHWSQDHYGKPIPLLGFLDDCVPLVIFEGDVGTGKTALAETIGQRVAEAYGYPLHLLRMSTRVRGTGYVGEMGTLLAESFRFVLSEWEKLSAPIVFIIDEADSLLTTRSTVEQHHEDKSGVNTILQHLDLLRDERAQVVVVAITNRFGVLDPAVRRRAAAVHTFERPGDPQRRELFVRLFAHTKLGRVEIERLVQASSEKPCEDGGDPVPFTYSDLTLRFAIPALRDAIRRDEPLGIESLETRLLELKPSPPMEAG